MGSKAARALDIQLQTIDRRFVSMAKIIGRLETRIDAIVGAIDDINERNYHLDEAKREAQGESED